MCYFLFLIFATIATISAIFAIFSKNPIFSVLFLILCFYSISSLLFLFHFEFLPIFFLIVYVGAIAVLFVFILMMINLKLSELNDNHKQYIPLFFLFLFTILSQLLILFSVELPSFNTYDNASNIFLYDLLNGFIRHYNFISVSFFLSNMTVIAYALFNNYLFCFIASGLFLLSAMVGAIVLTLHKHFIIKNQNIYQQILKNYDITVSQMAVTKSV